MYLIKNKKRRIGKYVLRSYYVQEHHLWQQEWHYYIVILILTIKYNVKIIAGAPDGKTNQVFFNPKFWSYHANTTMTSWLFHYLPRLCPKILLKERGFLGIKNSLLTLHCNSSSKLKFTGYSEKMAKQISNLISTRPFVLTNLQGQLTTATIYIIPILHATIYRIPAAGYAWVKHQNFKQMKLNPRARAKERTCKSD